MKQVDLRPVKTSFDTRTKSLQEIPADVRNDLHEEPRTLKPEIRINEKREEAKIEATRLEFQAQLKRVEARTELGEATSSALFRRQFETIVEHNCWTHQEKSTYLINALQGRATDELYGVPKEATFENVSVSFIMIPPNCCVLCIISVHVI